MPKNGVKISGIAVIRIIVFLFIAYMGFALYSRVREFMLTDRMFMIKDVLIESSIQFIDTKPLIALKGHNIFDVDVSKVQRQLSAQYPQIAQFKVVRQLPDRIKVLAKRRDMMFQVAFKDKFLLVDKEGVGVIYVRSSLNLPTVMGFSMRSKISIGKTIDNALLLQALAVIRKIQQHPVLSVYKVNTIDVANPAKISVVLNQIPANIIIDNDHGVEKLDVLAMLLSQKKLDLKQVDYVDLRFDQPVIASSEDTTTPRKR